MSEDLVSDFGDFSGVLSAPGGGPPLADEVDKHSLLSSVTAALSNVLRSPLTSVLSLGGVVSGAKEGDDVLRPKVGSFGASSEGTPIGTKEGGPVIRAQGSFGASSEEGTPIGSPSTFIMEERRTATILHIDPADVVFAESDGD